MTEGFRPTTEPIEREVTFEHQFGGPVHKCRAQWHGDKRELLVQWGAGTGLLPVVLTTGRFKAGGALWRMSEKDRRYFKRLADKPRRDLLIAARKARESSGSGQPPADPQ